MAFQKLTDFFLIGKFAMMLDLIANVATICSGFDSLTEKAPYLFYHAKPEIPFSLSRYIWLFQGRIWYG
jgi:hypothetical protein